MSTEMNFAPAEYINYLPITSHQTLQLCASRNVHDCNLPNIFIASYPKSGTTWMQAIVYALLSNGNDDFQHISNYSPFYEIDPHWDLAADGTTGSFAAKFDSFNEEIGHQVFNTHLRWSALPKGGQARYIYVYRDGKDAATSFYHHLTHQDDEGGYTGDFDQFFQDWISNKIIFGSWAKHLQEFLAAARDPSNRILVVRYEDLQRDLGGCVQRVAAFLDCPLSPEHIRSRIVPKVTFEYMKANKDKYQPISVKWKNDFQFLRKGVVGDSATVFSAAQCRAFDDMMQSQFPGGLPAGACLPGGSEQEGEGAAEQVQET